MSIDYRDFDPKNKKKEPERNLLAWWKCTDEDRPSSVTKTVQELFNNDSARRAQNLSSMRMYGNMNPIGLNGFSLAHMPSTPVVRSERLTFNVIQSAGDTVSAKIAKNKPKPMFLTSGGSYKLQRKAKKLDKFVEGVFYENDAYQMGPQVFTDAYVLGDGLIHVYAKDGRVKYDRVLAGELLTDWADSVYGNPSQIHYVKCYPRDVLLELFPDKAEEINSAQHYSLSNSIMNQNATDLIVVAESWHLRSGKEAKDGLHAITILGGKELHSGPWEKDYFPFAKLTWTKRQLGYWGQGGAEQIQSIQLEISKILWTIQRSYQLAGSVKLWTPIAARIVKEHLTNELGAVWESELKPEYIVPPIVPPEMYSQLKELKNSAFEQIGVSQLSANSQKPAGLDSGRALREYNNIETERFMILGQSYEHFFLQLSRLTIDCAREISETSKSGYAVKSPNSKFIETIDFKDVALDDDDMVLQMFPVSSLPNDPAGRMQTIQEWVQAGWITPRTAKRIMNFPDLEAVEELENSKEDYLHMIIEKIIDDGEFTPPEPFDDLPLAKELFLDYYAFAKTNGVEEDKLELLRNFNEQVDILVQKALPPPQPQVPGAGGPQAAPMAPPQSDLLQNTPTAA